MNIDLSIIIPMYNTGRFVNKCIGSIKSTFLNFEIIIIDDGSEDNSFQIVNEIAEFNNKIILVRTENGGPGEARNLGLGMAKGKFITFIDSDDWIIDNALDILYKEITDNNLDIVIGNALFYYNEEDIRIRYKIPNSLFEKVHQGKECYVRLSNANSFIPMVYCYMYRHEFLKKNNIHFQKEMYEDELWTLQTVCLADRIKIIDYPFYYYRQRKESIMNGGSGMYRQSSSLITLSKNILFFSQNNSFIDNNDLKEWLYVRATQMLYYAITKLSSKKDLIAFSNNNAEIMKELLNKRYKTHNNIIQHCYKYYSHNIHTIMSALSI